MRTRLATLSCVFALALCPAPPLVAQGIIPSLGQGMDNTLDPLADAARRSVTRLPQALDNGLNRAGEPIEQAVAGLAKARIDRLDRLLRQNPALIERDRAGNPARKGEVLLVAPDAATLGHAQALGFTALGEERLASLDLSVTRLSVPAGLSLARAQALLDRELPGATITADVLHFPAGTPAHDRGAPATAAMPPLQTAVGMIDGAPAQPVDALQGFAPGVPTPSDHGSAVASLLSRAGVRHIAAADVYGRGPAGGSALAIAQAVNWLIGRQIRVITISLVGPANPLLARAIAAALQRGAVIVAAVGNDGPAAPPAYPASYPGVLAVTAVDARNRALIEAGRALHLDYAAPGAGIRAANARGQFMPVRGTSFAAPLVAARAAAARDAHAALPQTLDREAIDLGTRGPDAVYGRGLLCTICR